MDIDKELKDIFDDPLLDISDTEVTLFNLPSDMKRVMEKKRLQPDHYAQRKTCEDFELYKDLFVQVNQQLKEGKRNLIKTSKTSSLDVGRYYIISGQMLLLESITEKKTNRSGMIDGRTRCIFEDGTETDILLETLRRNILHDGYGITDPQEETEPVLTQLATGDKSTGYIYILRSLSPAPEIANVKNLYKIGFTINSVEERVANAVHEPTYLMAPVQIVSTAQIVNMNSQIFETLVHQVFQAVNFKVKVYDDNGIEHEPSEWYVAPLEIIELVIQKIADRSIVNYSYNAEMQCLEKRIVKKTSTFDTTGLMVLTLNIKEVYFKEILSGKKTIEYRELKQTTLNKYTYVDEADGKRYLRRYDAIRFYVGYHKDRDSGLIQVLDTTYNDGIVEYHLGAILEHIGQN